MLLAQPVWINLPFDFSSGIGSFGHTGASGLDDGISDDSLGTSASTLVEIP